VIEDVVANVRDSFLDEGVDEQVLQEMKQIWTNRLMASKAVEVTPEPAVPASGQPAILANNSKVSCNHFLMSVQMNRQFSQNVHAKS
jgi:transcription initiation factor TFIIA large subunit